MQCTRQDGGKRTGCIKIWRKDNSFYWYQTFAMFWMFHAFLWAIPWRLNFIYRRFGTLCLFHLHWQLGMKDDNSNILKPCRTSYLSAYEDGTDGAPKRRHMKFRRRGTQKKALKYSFCPWSNLLPSDTPNECCILQFHNVFEPEMVIFRPVARNL